MTLRPLQLTDLRRWLSSPVLYARRARWKLFGRDLQFLQQKPECFSPGSPEWFATTELKYGGFQQGGVQSRVCQGGDRMSPYHHDYAADYARFLQPWLASRHPVTLIEVGILNGTGLALWCDLFPNARIIGLDIDISNFHSHFAALQRLGAFSRNTPEVHTFDQLNPAQMHSCLSTLLGTNRVQIVIDDGCHSIESIENTFTAFLPFLAPRFTYFIEDNRHACAHMRHIYPRFRWLPYDELTVGRPA